MKKSAFQVLVCWVLLGLSTLPVYASPESINCWFPPSWKARGAQAKLIADTMSQKSGIAIQPRIAKNYLQILNAFSSGERSLVYVGSFAQAIIWSRNLGTPLVQSVNGKERYSGILVYPKGGDPVAILSGFPDKIAYTIGASSGESSAKAATGGKAAIGVVNHTAAASAVKAGKAKAAVVKNWWWADNKDKFPMLDSYMIPGVSEEKNPDNVLTASKTIPVPIAQSIADAAISSKEVFGARQMVPFDPEKLDFSISLMKMGGIDPLVYEWK